MPDRSSRPQARHVGPALVVLASLGIAEAAPPAGKPVSIHTEGLAPTSVGQNGFIVAGDFTEGGAFYWMPTSGVTLVGGGLGSGFISRDGKAMAGTVIDPNRIQQAAKWEGGRSWRTLGPLVPNAVPCQQSLSVAMGTSGDGRVVVGSGWSARTSASDQDRNRTTAAHPRSGGSSRIASASIVMKTWLPTTMPPRASGLFQLTPKS